jgi:hypothetical protein
MCSGGGDMSFAGRWSGLFSYKCNRRPQLTLTAKGPLGAGLEHGDLARNSVYSACTVRQSYPYVPIGGETFNCQTRRILTHRSYH